METKKSREYESGIHDNLIGKNTKIYYPCNVFNSEIGESCVISPFVQIEGAKVGNNCKIHTMVSICKFVTIEDNVFIAQGVMFTNSRYPQIPSRWKEEIDSSNVATLVKYGVSIGANATILSGVTIGKYATIGAGAVVTKDIEPNVIAYGNPCEVKREK